MDPMAGSSFRDEIGEQIRTARTWLDSARDADDEYLTRVHQGSLEELERLAAAHGVVIEVAPG